MPKLGKTTARGYGAKHKAKRATLKPLVDAGLAFCWRCQRLITPGTPWDLGHDDHDRTLYRGPEHAACNRRSAARRTNYGRRTQRRPRLVPMLIDDDF